MRISPLHSACSFLLLLFAFAAATLTWTGAAAATDEAEWIGQIQTMPAEGLTGLWTVGGRTFVAGAGTEFRQEKGALAVGICAEVEYVGASEPYTAVKIASKNADDCSGGTATPSPSPSPVPGETPTPSETPSPGGEQEIYGIVTGMPMGGLAGTWRVDGTEYTAPAGAEFKQEHGPLVVGACVKLHLRNGSSPSTIREIETRRASQCSDVSPTPDITATPEGEIERYGRIESFPAGLTGDWRIDGVTYRAEGSTEFEQEDGAFAVGRCVKIHADGSSTPMILREVESERSYHCAGGDDGGDDGDDDDRGEAEIYGVVQSFPDALIGTWNVAGMTFVAHGDTEFEQENSAFGVGVTVKIHFRTDADGVHHAREIETKFANDDDGIDDDRNGSVDGAEGHAYGRIDSFPAGLQGVWSIGGVEYVADTATRFAQEDGQFAADVRAKVEYYVAGDGARVAKKIETTDEDSGTGDTNHAVFFGFVRSMPASGLVGLWTVDNAEFTADMATEFKEDHGLLGLGAYVAVEYSIREADMLIHELETHVPPGAGPASHLGLLERQGATLAAAVDAGTTWTIDGLSYSILPATALDDAAGALRPGAAVIVNSYSAADGSRIATRVRAVEEIRKVYLPVVTHR